MTLLKPTRKPISSLGYSVIKHHGSILLEEYCSCTKLFNTLIIPLVGYPKNTLGCITYLLKLGGVLHSPTKTYKESNTLPGVFKKHDGLNYFGLNYQRGIVHGYKYTMHMHYPINSLGFITYLLKLARVLHSHTKT